MKEPTVLIDIPRMEKALSEEVIEVPKNLTRAEIIAFIIEKAEESDKDT